MSLSTGARLGPYEILDPLGAGGMGEVYRARDTRLERLVAIKIASNAFSERFEREARLISSLNHPHICTVYDVGPNYLVMELVEGDTIADRIARGPIAEAEALPIARQIVEALVAAHERGVIHRDLKPANVKLTDSGEVKVLDFGLAKVAEAASAGAGNPANSPTLTIEATRAGIILGTAAYMPPEQARGAVVDKRADIWAFGCLLFEMLSGKRLFGGASTTDVLAAVIRAEPDWSQLPASTSEPVRRLLKRCLEKDRKRRLPDIGVACLEIDDALAAPAGPVAAVRARPSAVPWAIAAAAVLAAASVWLFARAPAAPMWTGTQLSGPTRASAPRLSPDGQLIAFCAIDDGLAQLAVMKADGSGWTILSRERDQGYVSTMSWSRDGRQIFYDRYLGERKAVYSLPPLGGEPRLILEDAFSPDALPDGNLLVVKDTERGDLQIFRYSPESARLAALPVFVAPFDATPPYRVSRDGKRLLFFGMSGDADRFRSPHMWVLEFASGATRQIPVDVRATGDFGYAMDFSADGRAVLSLASSGDLRKLVSVPLDGGKRSELLSFPSNAAPQSIDAGSDGAIYADQILLQRSITVVQEGGGNPERTVAPGSDSFVLGNGEVAAITRIGGKTRLLVGPIGTEPRNVVDTDEETSTPAAVFGDRLAFIIGSADGRRIAIASRRGGRVLRRFSASATGVVSLAASPDGKTLYYSADGSIWAQPSEGGDPRRISDGSDLALEPDGRFLYVRRSRGGGFEVARVPTGGGGAEPLPLPASAHYALVPLMPGAVDRSGRFLATLLRPDSFYYYAAVVDPTRKTVTPVRVSNDGDVLRPVWLPDGRIATFGLSYRNVLWKYTR